MTERPYRSLIRALAFLVGFVAALVLCTGNAKAGDREQYVRPDVAGNLDFQMDNMPDWMIYPSLSALLQGGGIDCTVIGIFDNGTFHGDHYVTIECEGYECRYSRWLGDRCHYLYLCHRIHQSHAGPDDDGAYVLRALRRNLPSVPVLHLQ